MFVASLAVLQQRSCATVASVAPMLALLSRGFLSQLKVDFKELSTFSSFPPFLLTVFFLAMPETDRVKKNNLQAPRKQSFHYPLILHQT